jgi:hypothetical protein
VTREGVADCVERNTPALDCDWRDKTGIFYEPLNRDLYSWLETSKAVANVNEPKFWPLFDSYKINPCVNDSRRDFDKILKEDKKKSVLRCDHNPHS